MGDTGLLAAPELREAGRIQRVSMPEAPTVGEVVGLGVFKGQGILLRFEMVASTGRGRIIPLGSIQRVMKESIDAAVSYIRTHARSLGIDSDRLDKCDISILATQMGIPKEGPSAGIAILVGLVSMLEKLPVRNDIALTGEITLMGRILGVGQVQEKLRVALEAGVQEVFLPQENEKEVFFLPPQVQGGVRVTLVSRVEEVLERAFARA
jgi:ATP-dependent Lon protease